MFSFISWGLIGIVILLVAGVNGRLDRIERALAAMRANAAPPVAVEPDIQPPAAAGQ